MRSGRSVYEAVMDPLLDDRLKAIVRPRAARGMPTEQVQRRVRVGD